MNKHQSDQKENSGRLLDLPLFLSDIGQRKNFLLKAHTAFAVALENLCLKSFSQRNKYGTEDQNVHIQIHTLSIKVPE